MPSDAQLALQASVTKTATFNGSWIDLSNFPPLVNFIVARVIYSAATNASGSNSVTFSLDVSNDGSTVAGAAEINAADKIINLSTTAQAGEQFMPVLIKNRYIRLTATFAGAGSTPTITYQGDIVASWP